MALEAEDYQDLIDAAAAKPAEMSSPSGSAKLRPLSELIEAQKQAAANAGAADNQFFGLRVRKARFGRCGESCE